MSTVAFVFLVVVVSSCGLIHGRSLSSPEQFIPLLFSSPTSDGSPSNSVPSSNPNRLFDVVEQIIKYVSTIKSNEAFINNLVNRQKQVTDKLKALRFLKNCFQITESIIDQELTRSRQVPRVDKKALISSTFTLQELNEARTKIHNLIDAIDEKAATFKAWIPPTMPFLSF